MRILLSSIVVVLLLIPFLLVADSDRPSDASEARARLEAEEAYTAYLEAGGGAQGPHPADAQDMFFSSIMRGLRRAAIGS